MAYGFGGQRIAFTREDVGGVHTVDAYRTGRVGARCRSIPLTR